MDKGHSLKWEKSILDNKISVTIPIMTKVTFANWQRMLDNHS
jgi:hypothetical protein